VEQDDIDFDEEELEGERDDRRPPQTNDADDDENDQDVPMATETDATDQMDESSMPVNVRVHPPAAAAPLVGSSSRAGSTALGGEIVPPPVLQKRRMVITHDKYMTLQSLIVLHLSATERETGRGIDRDELIDWYLELKESEVQDVEELEYEREMITKMLRRLVKDNYLIEVKGDVQDSLPPTDEASQESSAAIAGDDVRVFYMVHPSVDTEGSSLTSTS
jgi:DNA replication licensing factor MCM6